MKQTLSSFPLTSRTGLGASPKARLAADVSFQANTGEVYQEGSWKVNYREIDLEASGDDWLFPNTIIDTNTDALNDKNSTYSLYIVNTDNGRARWVATEFENWSFTASFGDTVAYAAVDNYNLHRMPLLDNETYSKNQINSIVAGLITPLTAKAVGVATLVNGTVDVTSSAVEADSKILVTGKSDGVTGTVRVPSQTAGAGFTLTSNNGGDNGDVGWVIV